MEKKEQFIRASVELIRQISKDFGVSTVTVHHALNYDVKRGNSPTACKLRRVALERGAKLFVEEPDAVRTPVRINARGEHVGNSRTKVKKSDLGSGMARPIPEIGCGL